MNANWQPLGERVRVERIQPKPGHIILTDVQTVRWARVVAIGKEVYDLEVGDVVLLPGLAAETPDFEEGQQILVHMNDIGCKAN